MQNNNRKNNDFWSGFGLFAAYTLFLMSIMGAWITQMAWWK